MIDHNIALPTYEAAFQELVKDSEDLSLELLSIFEIDTIRFLHRFY